MDHYELIKNVIRITPILLMVGSYIYFLKLKWYKRFAPMFLIGWCVIAVSTWVFWSYSFNYAPSHEIQAAVALKDGAPRLFGVMFGWAYGLVILLLLELINLARYSIIKIRSKL